MEATAINTPPRSKTKLLIRLLLLSCICIPVACTRQIPDQSNGKDEHKAMVNERYDQTIWLCSHNAYNAEEAGFKYVNQTHGIQKQLENGVRALMLDVWEANDEVVLRHSDKLTMLLGHQPLTEVLMIIRQFLETDSDAIITLIFESYVPAEKVARCFDRAGLVQYCHVQNRDRNWPTLNMLRNADKRLVVLSDRAEMGPDWYMPVWDHCFETHWEADTPNDLLNNQAGRGAETNSLFIANHFLSNPLKSRSVARTVNNRDFLERRFGDSSTLPRLPNFIVVDFYEVGDCLEFVNELKVTH